MERGCGGGRKSEREGREKRRKGRDKERRGSREGESPTYYSFGSKVALVCIIIYTVAMGVDHTVDRGTNPKGHLSGLRRLHGSNVKVRLTLNMSPTL